MQPSTVRSVTDVKMNEIASILLKLIYPCHNQAVERHVKVVTEVSAQVVGFEKINV